MPPVDEIEDGKRERIEDSGEAIDFAHRAKIFQVLSFRFHVALVEQIDSNEVIKIGDAKLSQQIDEPIAHSIGRVGRGGERRRVGFG